MSRIRYFRRGDVLRMDRQHDKEVGRRGDGIEAVPEKAAQQLVGTEQGKMSQDGTARTDD